MPIEDSAYDELLAQFKELKARTEEYSAIDGCSIGNCSHDTTDECVKAQAKIISDDVCIIENLRGQVAAANLWRSTLSTRVAKLVEKMPEVVGNPDVRRPTIAAIHVINRMELRIEALMKRPS